VAAPKVVKWVAALTALFSFRMIAGGRRAYWAITGGIPAIYAVGGVGDLLAGVTAPLVAYALLCSRSRTAWLMACLWHLFSACDFVFGNAAHFIAVRGAWVTSPGAPPVPITALRVGMLSFLVLLDIVSIIALNRDEARAHFDAK
jgi:hypothetical protein